MKRRAFIKAVPAAAIAVATASAAEPEQQSPIRPALPFDLAAHPAMTEPGWRWDKEKMCYEKPNN